jgi:hypothetical protein
MFDLRYHVASLAAVLIAIAVGIVIGVAIASGGGVEETTADVLRGEKERVEEQLAAERQRVAALEDGQRAANDLLDAAYPVLMGGLLEGSSVAVLYLGPVSSSTRTAVERTLSAAGAGAPVREFALELPVDPETLAGVIAADPALAAFGAGGGLEGLGRGLGREFVDGGEMPVWEAVDELVVEESAGSSTLPATGVVVVRSWEPPEGEAASEDEAAALAATDELLGGLIAGLEDGDVPVVGVERAASDPSAVPFFRDRGLSSVDNVDTLPGRVALALLLAGAEPGRYGTQDGSDGIVPPFDSLPNAAEAVAG